jgi:hypothetical protein
MDEENVVFIHNGIFQPHRRTKFCYSQINGWNWRWMELENVILTEVSQAQKAKSCMFFLLCGL